MGETEVCRERLTFSRILARNGRLETGRFDGVRRRQSQLDHSVAMPWPQY